MIYVTEEELNEAYFIINEQYRSGIIAEDAKRASTYIDDLRKLEFIFDSAMGLKGHWVVMNAKVIEED